MGCLLVGSMGQSLDYMFNLKNIEMITRGENEKNTDLFS